MENFIVRPHKEHIFRATSVLNEEKIVNCFRIKIVAVSCKLLLSTFRIFLRYRSYKRLLFFWNFLKGAWRIMVMTFKVTINLTSVNWFLFLRSVFIIRSNGSVEIREIRKMMVEIEHGRMTQKRLVAMSPNEIKLADKRWLNLHSFSWWC